MSKPATAAPPASASGDPAAADFSLDAYPFYLLAQVDAAYSEQMEAALRTIGVSRAQWRVLMSLQERAPRSISALAELASAKLSTISRVVERMRAEGLVACAPRAGDGRVTEVYLEPAGERALEEIVRVAGRQYRRAMAELSQTQIDAFRDTLRTINANLRRSPIG